MTSSERYLKSFFSNFLCQINKAANFARKLVSFTLQMHRVSCSIYYRFLLMDCTIFSNPICKFWANNPCNFFAHLGNRQRWNIFFLLSSLRLLSIQIIHKTNEVSIKNPIVRNNKIFLNKMQRRRTTSALSG